MNPAILVRPLRLHRLTKNRILSSQEKYSSTTVLKVRTVMGCRSTTEYLDTKTCSWCNSSLQAQNFLQYMCSYSYPLLSMCNIHSSHPPHSTTQTGVVQYRYYCILTSTTVLHKVWTRMCGTVGISRSSDTHAPQNRNILSPSARVQTALPWY